ncbi:MAG: anthranilate phosphoribosyltransferase [Oceanospirillaceae bacterium]|uniref:anthranilate phosphoribosyltransferase n=1 Tax=Thalassolituus sp. UBA6592 TaxID=1947665 RepID=UPI000C4CB6F3|nr:anthranilate phosphoribosyltransferase [Thalassolituus sp. UBA6592]MAX98109.1 anthranilate phosphoribosyltransferase [Oceanospirillaceae bacterium]MBL33419.1 anthranilate phosphoribosyltransferase [Oceanospirillaceae bacterium]MBS54321.1 anthranilate phosphoribosyltransferase [Oceanospirillaceae bacterium]|tara:strand:- start:136 stop:1182 length:1047 start_codon:yes stop_codon:yes gene_type:complete
MDIKTALARVVERQDLSTEEMIDVMRQIMTGECDDAQVGGFLVGLRMKSESIDEIVGAVTVMRELATGVKIKAEHAVDIVGTGGDGANLFNVSTASSFIVAAAGGTVAKHGNRGVSSKSGSADLLEAAGVNLNLNSEQVARCIDELGVGFMFAPSHHSAMKHAIGPRKSLGMRTIFNILGPMTNPAGVANQVIGVFSKALVRPVAEVLQRMGAGHILVVNSQDGLDEISLATTTYACELKNGELKEYEMKPEDFGIQSQVLSGLDVADSQESLALIKDALGKRETTAGIKAADMLALNAGAAIYVAGLASNMKQGVDMAQDAIYSGLALEKLNELVSFSRFLAEDEAN